MRTAIVCITIAASVSGCFGGKTNAQTTENPNEARQVLGSEFYFLLAVERYHPVRLVHDSDLFSTWGEIVLAPQNGNPSSAATIRQLLQRGAKSAGWRAVRDVQYLDTPDLQRYEISDPGNSLSFEKTEGKHDPTRFRCRIWIAPNGGFIVAAYRVDTN